MNFFQAQDDARRKTLRLALLFGAAVLSLILLTNLLVAVVYVWTSHYARPENMNLTGLLTALPTDAWVFISIGVIGVVSVASLYKYLMVRGGGRTVAESLGGRLLTYDTTQGSTRRLLNVVEEMAIASGIPVPPVYLIPEPSINAFAAGFGPDDAVIGVNEGTVELLSRDELQGV
ncbi:MAG: M48 family metalloprotease, partial [Pseudomonadales bacterium]